MCSFTIEDFIKALELFPVVFDTDGKDTMDMDCNLKKLGQLFSQVLSLCPQKITQKNIMASVRFPDEISSQ